MLCFPKRPTAISEAVRRKAALTLAAEAPAGRKHTLAPAAPGGGAVCLPLADIPALVPSSESFQLILPQLVCIAAVDSSAPSPLNKGKYCYEC